jgi:hypothetical protein
MPLSVGEVSADVAPQDRAQPAQRSEPQPPSPSDLRRQRDDLERMRLRAARVAAN